MIDKGRGEAKSAGRDSDARTERWRDHRVAVRAEFVDAAYRALDRIGADATLHDICDEAGAKKPKLYRFFEDKVDLYNAIGDRVVQTLWGRLTGRVNLTQDSARELIHGCVSEYTAVVTEHPNVFRFMVQGHFTQNPEQAERSREIVRNYAAMVANMMATAMDRSHLDPRLAECAVLATFGAVATSTDWWLATNDATPENPISVDLFVRQLMSIIVGIVESTLAGNGIAVDIDQPLHAAISFA